ncbi:MAG: hypothetical protein IPM56_03135 [Ignavibacteriales bacterium]|nr:MAG: hypothetical protein IPM56_03135 [Ignavibacteriales bacterium]
MSFINLTIIILFIPFGYACKDEAIPSHPESVLTLSLEDVSCVEAW